MYGDQNTCKRTRKDSYLCKHATCLSIGTHLNLDNKKDQKLIWIGTFNDKTIHDIQIVGAPRHLHGPIVKMNIKLPRKITYSI